MEIFSFLPIAGSANPEDALLITRLFDAMDFFLAIAGTIRFFGSSQAEERSFFRILTTFLWTNALCCAVHNRLLMRHDWIWLDLLIAAPSLLLVPLIATRHAVSARPRSRVFVHAVRSGSPIFLAGTLVIIGLLNTRSHFYVGFAATLFAVAGYGTLNILTQTRGLEAEESLRRSKRALEKLVAQDALTCISNRRAFDEALSREMAAASRTQQPVSLLMIDVDRFKDLNDALGHVKGDEYLVLIAAALRVALPRASDFVARYGGEEFTAILPATDGPGALIAAERVREEVEDLRLAHPTAAAGVTTVSIGVSTFDGSPASSPADLIKAADGALYKAKRAGRNLCRIQPMDASADIRSVAANTRA